MSESLTNIYVRVLVVLMILIHAITQFCSEPTAGLQAYKV